MNQTEQLPPPTGNSNALTTTRSPIGWQRDATLARQPSDWLGNDKPLPTFVLPCGQKGGDGYEREGRCWGLTCHTDCELLGRSKAAHT